MGFVASAGVVDEDVECVCYGVSVCRPVGVFGVEFGAFGLVSLDAGSVFPIFVFLDGSDVDGVCVVDAVGVGLGFFGGVVFVAHCGAPFLGGERVGCFGGVLVDDFGEGFGGEVWVCGEVLVECVGGGFDVEGFAGFGWFGGVGGLW